MHSLPRKRNSRDKTRNNFGKLLLDFCKSNDFFILNGSLNGDIEGKLTCKGASVAGYCLCNVNILSKFVRLNVLELYSDAHSPISVSIKVKEKTNNAAESRNQSNKEEVMNKWNPEKLQEFIENLETVKVIDLENKLINSNNDNTCKQSINQYIHDLSELFVDSAKKTLGTRTTINSKNKINNSKTDKSWFTVQCKFQRQNYRKLKRKYKRYKTDAVKNELAAAEREYKRTLDTSMSRHRKDMQNKLKTMRTKNPKEFVKFYIKVKEKNNQTSQLIIFSSLIRN